MSDDARAGVWRGRIDRAPDGSIVGELVDPFSAYRLIITGRLDPAAHCYVLTARGEGIGAYRIPAIDGEGP